MKCIYHSADLDGHCSGAIVKRRHPECEMIGWNYGRELPEFAPGDEVVLVDVSFPMDDMSRIARELSESGGVMVWIDHHKSAIRDYNALTLSARSKFSANVNTERAACELTWEYMFPDEQVPVIVELLGMYDSWRYVGLPSENSVLLCQAGMKVYEDTRPENAMELWEVLFAASHRSLTYQELLKTGRTVQTYQEIQNKRAVGACAFETHLPYGPLGHLNAAPELRCIAMNHNVGTSAVFKSIYDSDEHEAMLVFYRSKRGFWRCSIYSDNENVDCSVYAKSYGGGGHKGAAGFMVSDHELPFDLPIAEG